MSGILKIISSLTNFMHDILIKLFKEMGFALNDKQLHFIVIAIIGMVMYLIVHPIFKKLAKLSISTLSFIYTFTVMVVFVFAIEIEQKITSRGNMEFADIVAGLWGFLCIFALYAVINVSVKFIYRKYINSRP